MAKQYVAPELDIVEVDANDGNRYSLPYGIAKGLGLDTTGMRPREVWEMLKGRGITPENEYDKLKEKAQQVLRKFEYDEIKPITPSRDLNLKIKDAIPLNEQEIEEVMISLSKTYIKPVRGDGDKNLKKILEANGFSKVPKRVKKENLVDALSTGTIFYRGIHGEAAKEQKNEFYKGELFVGTGFGGNGVYMSKDFNEAVNYGNDKSTIVCAIMPNDFKIAGKQEREEYKKYSEKIQQKYSYQAKNTKEINAQNASIRGVCSFGTWCALKGYDAYYPVIKPEINMVILNRAKMVIGENNEQERIMELD